MQSETAQMFGLRVGTLLDYFLNGEENFIDHIDKKKLSQRATPNQDHPHLLSDTF